MDIFRMMVFLSILDTGSFSETARRVGTTQPAVSAALKAMEEELGTRLVERTAGQRRNIRPTRSGQLLAKFCRETVSRYEHLKLDIMAPATRVDFTLSVSPSANAFFASVLYKCFCRRYPKVHCSYLSYRTAEEIRALKNGTCDIAIFAKEVQDDALTAERFFYDPLQLVAPGGMDLPAVIKPKELKKLPLIIRDPSIRSMQLLRSALAECGLEMDKLNIVFKVQGVMDELQSVTLGHGCAFVPHSLLSPQMSYMTSASTGAGNAADSAGGSPIKLIRVEGLEVPRHLYLARLKDAELPLGARVFWDYAFTTGWRDTAFDYDTMWGVNLVRSS